MVTTPSWQRGSAGVGCHWAAFQLKKVQPHIHWKYVQPKQNAAEIMVLGVGGFS